MPGERAGARCDSADKRARAERRAVFDHCRSHVRVFDVERFEWLVALSSWVLIAAFALILRVA